MKTKKNKKGFTLAELLIVVAIIAVLVAIAIPVFSTQLEKSREATDVANIRNAYAEVVTTYLADNSITTISVEQQQKTAGWQTSPTPKMTYQGGNGSQDTYDLSAVSPQASGSFTVTLVSSSDATVKPSVGQQ
jgi:type IV pilus assembly protein PilA